MKGGISQRYMDALMIKLVVGVEVAHGSRWRANGTYLPLTDDVGLRRLRGNSGEKK
jgi:hypothetical protein